MPIELSVAKKISLSFPQVLPGSDFRNLLWLCTLVIIGVVCGVKEYGLSNVAPKNLRLFIMGILTSWTEMFTSSLYSFQFMNIVAVELAGESVVLLAVKKRERSSR